MHKTRARVIDQVSSVSDNVLFVAIFSIGLIGISILRLATSVPPVVTLLVPLSLMGLYSYVVWRTERYRLREDHAADNIYYLGFLFTVTTLMIALVRYGTASDPEVNQIIGDLGVGLITTIVGLVGRIFFAQLRQDPEEIEEQTRLMLSEVVENTKSKIFYTNEIIADVHEQSIQIMRNAKDTIDTTNKGVIGSVKQLEIKLAQIDIPEDIISKKMDQVLGRFEKSVDKLTQKIDQIEIPPNIVSAKMEGALGVLEAAIAAVSSKIDAIQVDPEIINRKADLIVAPIRASVASLGESFEETEKSFRKINDHQEELVKFAEIAERLSQEKEKIAEWGQTIAENERQLVQLNGDLAQTQNALKSAVTLIEKLGREASGQQDNYGKSISGLLETIEQVQGGVRQLAETTESLAGSFSLAMKNLVEVANRNSSGDRIG